MRHFYRNWSIDRFLHIVNHITLDHSQKKKKNLHKSMFHLFTFSHLFVCEHITLHFVGFCHPRAVWDLLKWVKERAQLQISIFLQKAGLSYSCEHWLKVNIGLRCWWHTASFPSVCAKLMKMLEICNTDKPGSAHSCIFSVRLIS